MLAHTNLLAIAWLNVTMKNEFPSPPSSPDSSLSAIFLPPSFCQLLDGRKMEGKKSNTHPSPLPMVETL